MEAVSMSLEDFKKDVSRISLPWQSFQDPFGGLAALRAAEKIVAKDHGYLGYMNNIKVSAPKD